MWAVGVSFLAFPILVKRFFFVYAFSEGACKKRQRFPSIGNCGTCLPDDYHAEISMVEVSKHGRIRKIFRGYLFGRA